jgi:hypothetical protein
VLHLFAAIPEQERALIFDAHQKAALQAARARWTKLDGDRGSTDRPGAPSRCSLAAGSGKGPSHVLTSRGGASWTATGVARACAYAPWRTRTRGCHRYGAPGH